MIPGRAIMLAAALGLSGCAALPQKPTHLSGLWGGPHITLVLQGGLGTIEYDCASGTIDTPVMPAKDGRFSAQGTHRPGHGPVRVGQIFTSRRAVYSGLVEKGKMTLSAQVEDGTALGPFTLTEGAPGEVVRCL